MKLTGTNRPITYTTHILGRTRLQTVPPKKGYEDHAACVHYVVPNQQPASLLSEGTPQLNTRHHPHTRGPVASGTTYPTILPTPMGVWVGRVTAVIARGKRPVPFRTRKLRPAAPMVLHPGGCGRVGHRRTTIRTPGGVPGFGPRTMCGARPV